MRRFFVLWCRFAVLVLIGAACVVGAASRSQAEVIYRFGVPPWQRGQGIDDIRRLYRPMLEYLEAETKTKIMLVSASTYEEMVDYLAMGRVDFGTISPVPYVKAQQKNPNIHMLLTELSWNPDHTAKIDQYQGQIIVLKSRDDLKTLQDLRGKSFGFVSQDSSSGFVYPVALLARAGIDYQSGFSALQFLGSHPRVTDALAAGSIDAGATWNFNLAQAVTKHGDVFKVLAQVNIPNLGIATHPNLPDPVRQRIKQALLKIDPAMLDGLPTAGYVERPESFYDAVRTVLGVNALAEKAP